jgi:hypothetical protein
MVRSYRCCECKKELQTIDENNDCHCCGRIVCGECLEIHQLKK